MTKVNIVTVRSGWILQKIAERIAEGGRKRYPGMTTWKVTHNPDPYADVNFYCDVQNCFVGKIPGQSKHVGLFTHVHENNVSNVQKNINELDFIFHMCPRYMNMFSTKLDVSTDKMDIMVPFEKPVGWQVKKPRVGIFQRGKYEGKGFYFMLELIAQQPELVKKFEWVFVGNDWERVGQKLFEIGAVHSIENDSTLVYPDDYEELYESIDYLLVPSLWEGGPIGILEAVAKGIYVISADVGWAPFWANEVFTPNEVDELAFILNDKIKLKLEKARKLDKFGSFERCARQILRAVK